MGINLLHYGITLLLTYVAGPFITMVTLFGALTIGQLSSKHKGLMGILAYAGLTILSSIIGSTVQSAFMLVPMSQQCQWNHGEHQFRL